MWWWCGIIAVLVVAGCGGGSSDEPVPADSREGSTQVPAPAKEPRAVKSAWGEGQKLGAIFDDAPQEARPRDDQDAVRIKRLNEWLVKQDLASKTVSVTLPEAQMAMFEMDGGFRISYFHRPVNIDVHGVDFVLVLGVPAGIRLVNVDTDTADKLYEYKGKDTRITGKVERLFFNGRMLTLTFYGGLPERFCRGIPTTMTSKSATFTVPAITYSRFLASNLMKSFPRVVTLSR